MLDYAPDCLPGDNTASYVRDWTSAWGGETVLSDDSLVSSLMAEFREAATVSWATPGASRLSQPFQPERMSGYCAS